MNLGIDKIVGPVFVWRAPAAPAMVHKVLFNDGTQMVLAVVLQRLWSGDDGEAWSYQQTFNPWKNMGILKNGVMRL